MSTEPVKKPRTSKDVVSTTTYSKKDCPAAGKENIAFMNDVKQGSNKASHAVQEPEKKEKPAEGREILKTLNSHTVSPPNFEDKVRYCVSQFIETFWCSLSSFVTFCSIKSYLKGTTA